MKLQNRKNFQTGNSYFILLNNDTTITASLVFQIGHYLPARATQFIPNEDFSRDKFSRQKFGVFQIASSAANNQQCILNDTQP